MNLEYLIEILYSNDDKDAYNSLIQLENLSENDNEVYSYINEFFAMLDNQKSYIRVKGFRLICKNAKWDNDNKINKNIDKLLSELEDEKPTAVRQCLNAIKDIVKYKKELNFKIEEKVLSINYLKYNDSMRGLIFKDIEEVLKLINNIAI